MTATDPGLATARALAVSLIAAGVTLSAAATAEEPPRDERAFDLFEDGRRLAREGRCAEAVPLFEASVKRVVAVGPLLNLGHCLEILGKIASAHEAFLAAERAAAPGDGRRDEAAQRARALEARVSTLQVVVRERTARLVSEVLLDGSPLPPSGWNAPRSIDPGAHTITIATKDRRTETATVIVNANADHASYVVSERVGVPEPAAARPPPPARSNEARRTVGIAGIGVGAAGVVAGAIFGALSMHTRGAVNDLCPDYPTCPAASRTDIVDRNGQALTFGTVSTVGFVAGAALLTAGIVLFATSAEKR